MVKQFNTNTDNNDEWLTPPAIIKALGSFHLDPCSPINRPWNTAQHHFTKDCDGLTQEWFGRVWLNPPYGKETFKWVEKLASHKWGIALILARTETKGFHAHVWQKAHSVFFFKGRLKFHYVDGTLAGAVNAPSVLVSYSAFDTAAIEQAIINSPEIIKGKLVVL